MSGSLRLLAPGVPRLSLVVRTFVAEGSRFLGIDQMTCEDLRLAAHELFACGIGDGVPISFQLEARTQDVVLTVDGVESLSGPEGVEGVREQMLRALFPGLRHDGRTVVVRTPLGPDPHPSSA